MKKLLSLLLLNSVMMAQSNTYITTADLSIPLTQAEKKHSQSRTKRNIAIVSAATLTGATCGYLVNLATNNLIDSSFLGFFTGACSYCFLWKKALGVKPSLNEQLQNILSAKQTCDFELIELAQKTDSIEGIISLYKEHISTEKRYALVQARKNLLKTIIVAETAKQTFEVILAERLDLDEETRTVLTAMIKDIDPLVERAEEIVFQLEETDEFQNHQLSLYERSEREKERFREQENRYRNCELPQQEEMKQKDSDWKKDAEEYPYIFNA